MTKRRAEEIDAGIEEAKRAKQASVRERQEAADKNADATFEYNTQPCGCVESDSRKKVVRFCSDHNPKTKQESVIQDCLAIILKGQKK